MKIKVYQLCKDRWAFDILTANHQVIALSEKHYKRKRNANEAALLIAGSIFEVELA